MKKDDHFFKLPRQIQESLRHYIHSHEEILDFLQEVWVARYDVSWVILTNERVIIATRKVFQVKFADYVLKNLDIDISLGFPFDTLEIEAFSKHYTGHFYWFNRKKTLGFLELIEKKMEESEEEGTNKNEIERIEKECEPIDALKRLAELQKKGIITEEEFEEKKKKLLGEI